MNTDGLEKPAAKKPAQCKRWSISSRATCNDADEEEEVDDEDSSDVDVVSDVESEGNQALPENTDYSLFVNKGIKLLVKLEKKLEQYRINPQLVSDKKIENEAFTVVDDVNSPNGGYTYAHGSNTDISTSLQGALSYLPGTSDTTFLSAVVKSRGGDGKQELVGENLFSHPNSPTGILVAQWNKIKGDHNIAPENKKITEWSNLMYQTMIQRYGGSPTDIPDIRYVIRDEISNAVTQGVIKWAHKNVGAGKYDKAVFDISSQDVKEIEAFQALLGTPNGNGVAHLLADYPISMRGKRIVRIHTWRSEGDAEMILELGV